MSVRLKLISIIILTIGLFGSVIYIMGSKILIKNYIDIESDGVIRNLDRVSDAIINVSNQLDVKISDWATWDDTYKFIKDRNKTYIKSNLTDVSLQNLEIQGMFFYDTKGNLVYGNFIDKDNITSKSIERYLSEHKNIVTHESIDGSKNGIISLPEGNLFLASRPILTSEGEGPIGGTMVFVKIFGEEEIKSLSDLTHVAVSLFPYVSSLTKIENAKKNLSGDSKHFVSSVSEDTINGYSVLLDVNNSPIVIVEVKSPRTIFNQGQQTTITFMTISGVFALTFGILLILLIEKLVILRLLRLGSQAREIGMTNDLSKKINESGRDEISTLAKSINKMLEDLKNSEDEKEEALRKNEKIAKELAEHAEELEKFNKLMVGRELKMIELKKEIESYKTEIDKLKRDTE